MATDENSRARRAAMNLVAALVALVLVAATVVLVLVVGGNTPSQRPQREATQSPVPSTPPRDDAAANLAAAPMVSFPVQAAMPHELSGESAGHPLVVPRPSDVKDRWVPRGFPPTDQGALAQLAATTQRAMRGADPDVVTRAYRATAVDGAASVSGSALVQAARDFRQHAGLPPSGPVPGLLASYTVRHGLVKGSAEHGRFAVVCVLGEVTVVYQNAVAQAGLGECRALRWSHGQWRIVSGMPVAEAPHAWPGSVEAVRAGYRELRDA